MSRKRGELLGLTDDTLLTQCRTENFRATGAGGQHRNTTDSAVRLTLSGTDIAVYATDSRSQHRNKLLALRKLRLTIALEMREEAYAPWPGRWNVAPNHRDFPGFIAPILDALALSDWRLGDAAKLIGVSSGKLNRAISKEVSVWRHVNRKRQEIGLRQLTKS